jgi:hypothetical protein
MLSLLTMQSYQDNNLTPLRSRKEMALASTTMNTKEYQADAEAAVEEDFKLHYRTTDTNLFLEKLLPVNEKDVESILKSMEEKGTYKTRSKTWSGFPGRNNRENKYKEAILYTPFQTVAEAIRIAADTLAKKSDMGPASWVDYHSKSPKSFDGTGAKLRADVVLALDMVAKRGGGVKSQKTTSAEVGFTSS